MNSHDPQDPQAPESTLSSIPVDLDDDLDSEELGERQAEACSMEDGCQSCQ